MEYSLCRLVLFLTVVWVPVAVAEPSKSTSLPVSLACGKLENAVESFKPGQTQLAEVDAALGKEAVHDLGDGWYYLTYSVDLCQARIVLEGDSVVTTQYEAVDVVKKLEDLDRQVKELRRQIAQLHQELGLLAVQHQPQRGRGR